MTRARSNPSDLVIRPRLPGFTDQRNQLGVRLHEDSWKLFRCRRASPRWPRWAWKKGLVHTSTRYEPGSYGWERAQDFRALVKRNLISADDCEEVRSGLERFAAAGQYFYSITMCAYVGTKG